MGTVEKKLAELEKESEKVKNYTSAFLRGMKIGKMLAKTDVEDLALFLGAIYGYLIENAEKEKIRYRKKY